MNRTDDIGPSDSAPEIELSARQKRNVENYTDARYFYDCARLDYARGKIGMGELSKFQRALTDATRAVFNPYTGEFEP